MQLKQAMNGVRADWNLLRRALGRTSLISRLHGLANAPTTAGRPPADNCLGSPVIVGEGLCAAASRSRLWRRYRGHSNRGPSTAGSRTKNVSGYIVKRASPPANRKVAVHHGRTLRRCSGRRMSIVGGGTDNICSRRVLRILTHTRHRPASHVAVAKRFQALSKWSFEPLRCQ